MDQSWRFRSIQGTVCPICSISHFPFCSQSFGFDRSGFGRDLHHFPVENNLQTINTFHRPFQDHRDPMIDPFPDNRAPLLMPSSSHFENRPGSMIPGSSDFMNRAAQVMPDSLFMGNRPGSISPGPFMDQQIPLNSNPYNGNSIVTNEGLQLWSRSNSVKNQFVEREQAFPSGVAFQQSHKDGSQLTHFDAVTSTNARKFGSWMVREGLGGMERVQKRIKIENSGSFTEQSIRSDFMANESLSSGARLLEDEWRLNSSGARMLEDEWRSNSSGARMLEDEWRLNSSGARMLEDEWRLNLIREHGGQSVPGSDILKDQQLHHRNRVGESNFCQSNQSTGDNNLNSEYSYRDSNSFQQSLVEQRHSHESLLGGRRINKNEAHASSEAQRSMESAWPSSSDKFHNPRFNFTAMNGLAIPLEQAGGSGTPFLSENQPNQRNLYSQHQFPNAPNSENSDGSIRREKTELDRGASLRMGGAHDLGSEESWGQINSQPPFEQFHRDRHRPDLDSSFRNKEEQVFHSQNDQLKDAHHSWVPSNPSQFYGHGKFENSVEVPRKSTAGPQPSSDTYRGDMSMNGLAQSAWSPAFQPSSLHSDLSSRRNDLFLSESSSTRHQNFANPVWKNHQEEHGSEQTLSSLPQARLKEQQLSHGPHGKEQQLHLQEHSSRIPLNHPQHHLQHPESMHIRNWQALSAQNVHQRGHHEQHGQKKFHLPMEDKWLDFQPPKPYTRQHPIHGFHDQQNSPPMKLVEFKASQNPDNLWHLNKSLQSPSNLQLEVVENLDRHQEMLQLHPVSVARPIEIQNMPMVSRSDAQNLNKQGYMSMPIGNSQTLAMQGQVQSSGVRPPFPQQQQLLPMEPPQLPTPLLPPSHLQALPSPPPNPSSPRIPMAPAPISSASFSSSHTPTNDAFPEVQTQTQSYFNKSAVHSLAGFSTEGSQLFQQKPSKQYVEEGQHQPFQSKQGPPDKAKVVDAIHLFKQPHRYTRPNHIVIILRGLPGGGKSYLARALRDIEVENGGNAPRIHSMDDYFMTEVEKVEEHDGSNSTSSVKGKKRITKKVMEYCYEPEMEEAYRASMLKAFKKTLEEGNFTFIIVDDRNLRVADFAQFWAVAKMSGYEVYLLEATYKDPTGCAARNVHGFTSKDIQKMADQWEEAPSLYLQLDIQSLFHGDHLNQQAIQEVEMDMEDVACDEEGQETKMLDTTKQPPMDYTLDGSYDVGQRWETEQSDSIQEVKELGKSKWSEDVDDDDDLAKVAKERHSNALSGLIQAYSKGEKSVHWGDQAGKGGFSIGAPKKQNILSLIIGPGAGYKLDSNPLPEEENMDTSDEGNNGEFNRRAEFVKHLRAERSHLGLCLIEGGNALAVSTWTKNSNFSSALTNYFIFS